MRGLLVDPSAWRIMTGGGNHWRRRGRYNARAVRDATTGERCDSRTEAARYAVLQILQRGGAISGLTLHPKVVLVAKRGDAPEIAYRPDYAYTDDLGRATWEDSKARQRPGQRIRLDGRERLVLALWRHYGPGRLILTGGAAENWRVLREVEGGAP